MKKKLAIALAIIMIFTMFAFTGCGGSADKGGSSAVSGQQTDQQEQQEPAPEELMASFAEKLSSGPWYHTMKSLYQGEPAGTYVYTWNFDAQGNLKVDVILENAGFGQYITGTYEVYEEIEGGYTLKYDAVVETATEEGNFEEAYSGVLNFWFDDSGLLNMSYNSGDLFGNYKNGSVMPMSQTQGQVVMTTELATA